LSAVECDVTENCENRTTERQEEKWQLVVRKGKRTLTGITNNDRKGKKEEQRVKPHKFNNQTYPINSSKVK
jgi:hypothetical protein